MSRKPAAIPGRILLATSAAATIAAAAGDGRPPRHLTPADAVAGHCAAWNTTDRVERDLLLKRVFAPDGAYSDPDSPYVQGRAALSAEIAAIQHRYPGARFRCSAPQAHHNAMRVSWLLVRPDGSVVTQGMDFYQLGPDGLIRRVTGFFGPPPTLDPRP